MKTILIAFALLVSASQTGFAAEPWEIQIPSLEDQMNQVKQEKLAALIKEISTGDVFSGRLTQIEFEGKTYSIDRTSEPLKVAPHNTNPPRSPSVGGLLKDLGISSHGGGGVKLRIIHETYENGEMTSRDIWEIDMSGAWQAQMGGMDDAMSKQHK